MTCFKLIEREKANYPAKMMCELLDVSKSAFYAWRNPKRTDGRLAANREAIKAQVLELWEGSKKRFGGWSIWKRLTKKGVAVTLWLIRKLMHELKISGLAPKKKVVTTIVDPSASSRSDLLSGDFTAPTPTIKLAGDITYLKLGNHSTLYLAVVIDLCTRMVVGWALADHMKASLAVDALKKAWMAGFVAIGAIFHSDRGSQYTSKLFGQFAETISVRLSTGRKATCYDNAVSESFFATMKKEWFYRESFNSREELERSLGRYIEIYYNRQRPHSTLDGNTPYEEHQLHESHWEDILSAAA